MKIVAGLPPEAKKGQLVVLDLEMFGQEEGKLHRPTGKFATLSILLEGNNTVYQIYDDRDVRKVLDLSKRGTWVFHNALYDLRQLRRWATIKPRFIWDTMLVDQSVYGGYYDSFSLASLSRRYLNKYMEKEAREQFITAKEMTPQTKKYAAQDVVTTLDIAKIQYNAHADETYFDAYTKLDEPMIFPVLDMGGMRIDMDAWAAALKVFEQKGKDAEAELGFNSKSTQQTHNALHKIGLYLDDTGADTLMLYKDRPLVAKILEARTYRDAVSKYGYKWLEDNVESDGKVYPSWHITGADDTGRMSSSDPNGQNIPQRKLPIYRTFFVPSPGNIMVISDASAQEPCVTAYESHDKNLIKILQSGVSPHMGVAREVFHDQSINSKEDERYKKGKVINLAITYGMSPFGLAAKLNITEQEAESYIVSYFQRFPDVRMWLNNEKNFAVKHEYVLAAGNRRCWLSMYGHQWERNATNAPIQGGAAAQTKRWTRLFWEESQRAKLPYTLVGIIHDETVKDTPKEIRKEIVRINDETFLQSADELFPGIPFRVETELGKSWGAKQIKEEVIDEE